MTGHSESDPAHEKAVSLRIAEQPLETVWSLWMAVMTAPLVRQSSESQAD